MKIKHYIAFVLFMVTMLVSYGLTFGQSCSTPKLQVHPDKQFFIQPCHIVRWTKEPGVDAYEFKRDDGSTFIWQDCSVTADGGFLSFRTFPNSYFNVTRGMSVQVRAYCIPYCSQLINGGMVTYGYSPINLNNQSNWSGYSKSVTVK